jgi:hypothetical protein
LSAACSVAWPPLKERLAALAPALPSRRIVRFHHRQQSARQRFGVKRVGTGGSNQLAQLTNPSFPEVLGFVFESLQFGIKVMWLAHSSSP